MNFIDMFGGIGAFTLGLERQGHKCIGYYEIDETCVQVYNKRFGTSHTPVDITKLVARDVPDHDILCAGFPCQSFSVAGKKQGFKDIRGTLFAEICRIAQEKRPRLLLLENVKGLLNHDDGETFATILHSLHELGYRLEWEVINSKNFGVPQNRERVFIIGHLGEKCPREIFPLGRGDGEAVEERKMEELTSGMSLSQRIYSTSGISPPITGTGGGQGAKAGLYMVDGKARRPTPLECERLMGFPDNFTEGHSDTKRYEMLGNSIAVPIIEEIGRRL